MTSRDINGVSNETSGNMGNDTKSLQPILILTIIYSYRCIDSIWGRSHHYFNQN